MQDNLLLNGMLVFVSYQVAHLITFIESTKKA